MTPLQWDYLCISWCWFNSFPLFILYRFHHGTQDFKETSTNHFWSAGSYICILYRWQALFRQEENAEFWVRSPIYLWEKTSKWKAKKWEYHHIQIIHHNCNLALNIFRWIFFFPFVSVCNTFLVVLCHFTCALFPITLVSYDKEFKFWEMNGKKTIKYCYLILKKESTIFKIARMLLLSILTVQLELTLS